MSVLYPMPLKAAFKDDFGGRLDFLPAPDLTSLADDLIDRHERLASLPQITIHYLWKREGGGRNGKATYGKCQKPSGLLAHYSRADFVIWLAADRVQGSNMTSQQVEALLLHEMLHIGRDPETDAWVVVGHDVEEFAYVIQSYGLWNQDLERFRQIALFECVDRTSGEITTPA
ncbi:MAG TPA: putative metallopeptidase [Chloroflexota bacterium]